MRRINGSFYIARRLFFRVHFERGKSQPLLGVSIGIALSLIPLVTVYHLADAMIEGIIARYRETSTGHIQIRAVVPPKKAEWENLRAKISRRKGIRSVWVERQGLGLGRAQKTREALTLRAIPSDAIARDPIFGQYFQFDEGRWDLDSPNSILLGREAARRLNAAVGDNIQILTLARIGARYVPKVTPFVVRGIFSVGYQDLDRTWAFIPLQTGWTILSNDNSRTWVSVKANNPDKGLASLQSSLSEDLPKQWILSNWKTINRYLLANLESTRDILLLIMGLIIVVAVLNVTTSLIMLTVERQREIGILKCTGTPPMGIVGIVVAAGGIASLLGTLAGLGMGLLVAKFINQIIAGLEAILGFFAALGGAPAPDLLAEGYYLQDIPIHIRWKAVGLIGAITFVLALCSAYIPAARASRLKPLEVLQKH